MEISQHIKNLLKTNDRVILSGFGVFSTKHISASIDKETKVMKPPFKIVVFDQNVTEDAGLLVKYMAEQEKISLDNAREQIVEYVKTVKTKLASGQTVEFIELGTFKQSSGGDIEFSFLSDDNLLLDSYGLPVVTISEQPITPPVEVKKPVKEKPIKEKPLKEKPVKQRPVKEKKTPVQKPPRVKKEKPVRTKTPKSDRPKKKRRWLVPVIIIGLIGIFLAAVYFFKPDLWNKGYNFSSAKFITAKNWVTDLFQGGNSGQYDVITNDENENEIEDTSNTEVFVDTSMTETVEENELVANTDESIDETVDETTETNEVSVNENPPNANNGKYYIIVGSVKSEAAAKNEKQRFANKGISTDIIYAPKIDRYRISIGNFKSAKEAQNYFEDFQTKHGNIDAWVWEKR